MKNIKISRQDFSRIRQADLAPYAANIVQSTRDNPVYAPAKDIITELDALQQQYTAALTAAQDGGRTAIANKDAIKDRLLNQLRKAAGAIEELAKGDVSLIVAAGFGLRAMSMRTTVNSLRPPTVVSLSSTGHDGEVRVVLEDEMPSIVATHVYEYSLDGGNVWQNSTYNSRRTFVIKNLPPGRNLLLRFRTIGLDELTSEWGKPVSVSVM